MSPKVNSQRGKCKSVLEMATKNENQTVENGLCTREKEKREKRTPGKRKRETESGSS